MLVRARAHTHTHMEFLYTSKFSIHFVHITFLQLKSLVNYESAKQIIVCHKRANQF